MGTENASHEPTCLYLHHLWFIININSVFHFLWSRSPILPDFLVVSTRSYHESLCDQSTPCCGCAEAPSKRSASVITTAVIAAVAVVMDQDASSSHLVRCEECPVPLRLLDPDRFPPDEIIICSRSHAALTTSCLRCLTAGMPCMIDFFLIRHTSNKIDNFFNGYHICYHSRTRLVIAEHLGTGDASSERLMRVGMGAVPTCAPYHGITDIEGSMHTGHRLLKV